jgi:nitrogen regulatory protein PII-like uncharacterized protein
VQGVTGHKSIGMTERYNHLEASQITDVMKAQAVIAGTQKTENVKSAKERNKDKNNSKNLRIINLPVKKSA